MGKYFLKLPKMGESVAEATLITWLKEVGDTIDADESVVEIATDKVDSDVPSEFKGKLIKKNFEVNDIVKVGEVIAEIETDLNDDTGLISEDEDIALVSEEKEKELINDNIEYINIVKKMDYPSNSVIHVFSEGEDSDFQDIIDAFGDVNVVMHINENICATFHHLVMADIMVVARSSFSYCAGLINKNVIVANNIKNWWHKPLASWKMI